MCGSVNVLADAEYTILVHPYSGNPLHCSTQNWQELTFDCLYASACVAYGRVFLVSASSTNLTLPAREPAPELTLATCSRYEIDHTVLS